MANIENLKVWNDAIELSVNIYKLMTSDNKLNSDYWLKDQIQRSSVSIASNIAEWADRDTQKEFSRFLYIARWSCSELKTQLTIIKELNYIQEEQFEKLNKQIIEIHKMINWMLKTVSKNL